MRLHLKILIFSFPLSFFGFYPLWGLDEARLQLLPSFLSGDCFTQSLDKNRSVPQQLKREKPFPDKIPYVVGTAKHSFLEMGMALKQNPGILRMGQDTALEFRKAHSYFLHRGSLLFSHREVIIWKFFIEDNLIEIKAMGTWMMERLSSGLKIILLEGELSSGESAASRMLSSGEMIIINSKNPAGTQPIAVDLPLLLGTSRLVNAFPHPLPSSSRLFSAAQVQALRLKRRYNAFIGDVTKDSKLQLWTLPQNKKD